MKMPSCCRPESGFPPIHNGDPKDTPVGAIAIKLEAGKRAPTKLAFELFNSAWPRQEDRRMFMLKRFRCEHALWCAYVRVE